MYVQIRKYNKVLGGGTAEQVGKNVEKTALSRVEQLPGFVEYYALELDDGGFLSINVFEDQAGIEASKKFSAEWNKGESGGTLPEKPDMTFEGKIVVHHLGTKKKQAAA